MYEPVVLKKKQPRTLAGTPAGKAFIITSLMKILIPTTIFYLLGQITINNKNLIAELEEGYRNKEKTLHDEFEETREYWSAPIFRNVVLRVLKKESQKLLNTDNSNSPLEEVEANN